MTEFHVEAVRLRDVRKHPNAWRALTCLVLGAWLWLLGQWRAAREPDEDYFTRKAA